MNKAIILFAHGSRDPEWALPFVKIQRAMAARQPGTAIELAFLENMTPSLPETAARLVADGYTEITVAPLFMAQGSHLKRDLSAILSTLRTLYPHADITQLPALGDTEEILAAIANWLSAATTR